MDHSLIWQVLVTRNPLTLSSYYVRNAGPPPADPMRMTRQIHLERNHICRTIILKRRIKRSSPKRLEVLNRRTMCEYYFLSYRCDLGPEYFQSSPFPEFGSAIKTERIKTQLGHPWRLWKRRVAPAVISMDTIVELERVASCAS